MDVFVTGATGFVGRAVLDELAAIGYTPVILARRPESSPVQALAAKNGAKVVAGDVLDRRTLLGMAGCQTVIHLVGIISELGANTFENAHVRGTENAVWAARNVGVRRFIHMSALGARPNAVSRYHQTKWQAEELVRQSGLDFTIFRPSIIYGPGDQFVNQFAQIARWSPVLPVIGDGKGTLQPILVQQVARCFVKAISEPRAVGRTFDLGSVEALTFNQILTEIMRAMGKKRMRVHIPTPIARLMGMTLETVFPKLLGKAAPLNRDQVTMLGEKTIGDPKPAMQLFGVEPLPLSEGLGWLQSSSRR